MRRLALIVPILLLAACAPASTGSGGSASDPLASQSAPTKGKAPTKAGTSKPNDKGWVLQSYATKDDGLGSFGGTARITNSNGKAMSATFTLTLAKSGTQVASLMGSADGVAAGKTVTVQLISQDKYKAGKYASDFQVDVSY